MEGQRNAIDHVEQDARIGEVAQDLHHGESGHEQRVLIERDAPFLSWNEQLQVAQQVPHKKGAKKKACEGHGVFLRERRFQNS